MKTKRISSFVCTAIMASWFIVPCAMPYPVSWTPDTNFPDFWQQDPLIVDGNVACGPVSATNSLYWLAEKYGLPNLTKPAWQDVVNTLGDSDHMNTWNDGSTFSGNFSDGKWKYIQECGYGDKIVQKSILAARCDAPPTIDWIKQEIANGEDVEILIGYICEGDNPEDPDIWLGGHYVSVTGYDLDNFYIADPWNNNSSNNDQLPFSGVFSFTFDFDEYGNSVTPYTKDYLRVQLGWDVGFDYDYQIVFGAISQSPVCEPSTILSFCIAVICMAKKLNFM